MTEFEDCILEISENISQLQYVKELLNILSEECSKPENQWKHDRIALLIEIFISQNDCFLENIEVAAKKLEKKLSRKSKKGEESKSIDISPQIKGKAA